MGKTILKVIVIAIGLIFLPAILWVFVSLLGFIGPTVGFLIILLFPIILIGIIVGYNNGKKKGKRMQIEDKSA